MLESLTAGADRALRRAASLARLRQAAQIEPIDLLAALAEDEDGRAATLLARHGADLPALQPATRNTTGGTDESEPPPPDPEYRAVLADAALLARIDDRGREVGTEHLLAALLDADGPHREALRASGLRFEELQGRLRRAEQSQTAPIPLAVEIGDLRLTEPGEAADLGRILDASANRAREGLRVVEDYARFALNDPGLTRRLKEIRHRLAEAIAGLGYDWMSTARDTPGDVGTHIMTAAEQTRENPRAVLVANFKRATEALRSLEEYSKLIDVWLAGRFEGLRYDVYVVEKQILNAQASAGRLDEARLYFLVGAMPTVGDLTWIVEEALAGGVQVVQFREKGLPDREWLGLARELRILTARAGARFLVNDRPDLALLAGADGVHLGQEDVSVRDARRVLGHRPMVGVSTHTPAQIDAAILAGATYLGVGPVFESRTKAFDAGQIAGLGFVRHAAETTNLPWFAIGGIDEGTLDEVLEAGATRVAVGSAITRAERPRQAASKLRARLDSIA
ncbi:MAG: thiamine phosphate synthase [Isosphaeraceae bacterium]